MIIGFYIKKILGHALMPLSLVVLLSVVGLLAWIVCRRQRLGLWLCLIAAAVLVLFSYAGPSGWLAGTLERQYAPIMFPQRYADMQWVVVLAGGAGPDDSQRPALAQLGPSTLARLTEVVRLMRCWPEARMVVTGGSGVAGMAPMAPVMAQAAVELGLAADRVLVENRSRDTSEHPVYVAPIIGRAPFVLVTSADHMPRAMMLFRRHGLDPIAAPADFSAGGRDELTLLDFFPESHNLTIAARAWHEYLGIAWEKIKYSDPTMVFSGTIYAYRAKHVNKPIQVLSVE
jgi:uncharacterized SAM-binding protein YcdF (DUF218 family)